MIPPKETLKTQEQQASELRARMEVQHGEALADMLHLKTINSRFLTLWGRKTARGLYASVRAFAETAEQATTDRLRVHGLSGF